MSRLRIVFVLLLVALSALGPRTTGAQGRCVETCPDDDDDGNCPVGCVDCSCCVHAPTVLRTVPTLLHLGPAVVLELAAEDALPPSADLHELLDVPKPRLG